jgi:hypothetical protein
VKVYADPLLAETVPDGTFGGARPRRGQRKPRREPDPNAAQHLAELAREVAAYDAANRARRHTPATTERKAV